jgi:hypothetical protein
VRRLIILTSFVALGFALRVHLLGNQELRGDEGFTWNYIQKSFPEIVATIIREGDPQPPLHYWLQRLWFLFTGDSEFAMRAWSAFLSLLLVPLMYRLGHRLWSAEVGLIAAGLTAIHPQQIWFAQDVRNMYQLALIFLLTATIPLPRLASNSGASTPVSQWKHWLIYIACGVIAMYSHYYSVFFLLAHGAYFVTSSPFPRSPAPLYHRFLTHPFIRWSLCGLLIAACVATWALIILPVYSGGQLADPGSLSLLNYTLAVFGDLTAGPAFPDSVKLVFTLTFVLLSLISLISRSLLSPLFPRLPVYLSTCLLIPYLGIYAITLTRSTFNSFYFVFAFPAAYLLIAGAIVALYRRQRLLGIIASIAGVVAFGFGLNNHFYNLDYSKTRGMREVVARLAEAASPGDIYLANIPDPAQVYYIRGLGLNYRMTPGQAKFDPAQVDQTLAGLTQNRVWFVPVQSILDPDFYVQSRLLRTAILAEDDRFHKMRLMLFLPINEAQPLDARFADGIRLAGYYLTPNRLTLVWAADSPPSTDYTVFVHALAADTFNLASHDSPPHIPTSQWRAGQTIVDVHEFGIPTDQPVTLVAGMYQPATGQRLTLETESFGEPDAARVASLAP